VRAKKKPPALRCKVRRISAAARQARWRVARRGRTVATGSARIHDRRFVIDLERLRGVRRGQYRLTIVIGRGAGALVLGEALRVG
jgi:hypothetical protein